MLFSHLFEEQVLKRRRTIFFVHRLHIKAAALTMHDFSSDERGDVNHSYQH